MTSPWASETQIADFNRDGISDLAFASPSYNTDTVTVLLGFADGGFSRPASYDTSLQPGNLAAVDLNGDGLPDLAFTCGAPSSAGNGVGVLFALGDGGFSPEAFTFAVGSSFTPQGVGVADFNHDGFMDLAYGNFLGGISVFYGVGDGGLTLRLLTGGNENQGMAVGDFNEDGFPDALTMGASSSTPSQLVEYLGLPDGGFSAPVLVPGYHQFGAAGFVADLNGDGHLDVLVPDFQGGVSEFLGYGDGTFATEQALPRMPIGAFGDFDRDGRIDVAGDAFTPGIEITLGDGDGGFDPTPNGPYALVYPAGDMAVGDFNHDGKPDLAVANANSTSGYSQVSIFLNQCP